ncbi:MAG: hypothetical protein MEQ84_07855 [Mesorhizobium sp.]|nr:hypothetical protein [Mesorhizobium sp.]
MADIAAKKLFTSKGIVRAGGDLPKGLPAAEMKLIREAGGVDEAKSALSSVKDKTAQAEITRLERSVKDAEDTLAKAEGDEAKAIAEATLKDAQDALASARG